jgi:hypothetical protein
VAVRAQVLEDAEIVTKEPATVQAPLAAIAAVVLALVVAATMNVA